MECIPDSRGAIANHAVYHGSAQRRWTAEAGYRRRLAADDAPEQLLFNL
jgi:hypothetical protein